MPEISRFYGIVIYMNYREHPPPHFHAKHQEEEVTVEILSVIVEGKKVAMFLHINSVTYLGEYKLRLSFNNGSMKDVDLASELYGQMFEPLQEASYFRRVRINPDTMTIEWPNGADFAPEFLDEIGVTVEIQEPLIVEYA